MLSPHRDLIDKQVPRIHGSASLKSVGGGLSLGTLDYWARLLMPFDEAFRLYKERTKTLGYLATNSKAALHQQQQQRLRQAEHNRDG